MRFENLEQKPRGENRKKKMGDRENLTLRVVFLIDFKADSGDQMSFMVLKVLNFSLRLIVFTFSFWKKDAYSRKTNLNYIDS